MEKVTPEMEKAILNATEAVDNYRLVAEAVEINAQESTAPLCLGAIQPLYEKIHRCWIACTKRVI